MIKKNVYYLLVALLVCSCSSKNNNVETTTIGPETVLNDDVVIAVNSDTLGYFIDSNGKLLFDKHFEEVRCFVECVANVKQDGKWGIINHKGELVVPCVYDDMLTCSNGLIGVKLNEKYGFINTKGDVIIPFNFDDVSSFSDGLANVVENGIAKFINPKGEVEIISPSTLSRLTDFSDGIAGSLFNITAINKKGETISGGVKWFGGIRLVFEVNSVEFKEDNNDSTTLNSCDTILSNISCLSENWLSSLPTKSLNVQIIKGESDRIILELPGVTDLEQVRNLFLSNSTFKIIQEQIINPVGQPIGNFSEGFQIVRNEETDLYGFVNTEGELVIPCIYEEVEPFSEGLAWVSNANKGLRFLDFDGNSKRNNGVQGFINTKGELVIPQKNNGIFENFSEGLAVLYNGVINTKGEVVIPDSLYYLIQEFSDGLAVVQVKESGEYGYMNTKGEFVIPCIYYGACGFSNGLALVWNNKIDYYQKRGTIINKKGEVICDSINSLTISWTRINEKGKDVDELFSEIGVKSHFY